MGMSGPFQGQNLGRISLAQMLVVQPTALPVSVMHLLTSSYSECESGPDLQTGNQSRHQLHTDVSKTLSKDQEILLPQIRQDQWNPPQGPELHVKAFDPRTDGVRDS